MAAPGCILHRTLTRSSSGPNQVSVSSPAVCRETLYVVDIHRYSRDQGSSVYFPQAVLYGEDLYDVTLTDRDCRLRVTLDPGLNRLVERNVLQAGSTLRNATFTPAMAAQLPACSRASERRDSYRLVKVEVTDEADGEGKEGGARGTHVGGASLPWFGQTEPEDPVGPVLPLRANRSVFLPLWNNVDYSGEEWREAPPTDEEDRDEEKEALHSDVTVSKLRDSFLCGVGGVAKGTVRHQLIVRIINKSHLMYYGKTDRNCDCPYKAVLEVCDQTGSVYVVLWNSVCVSWYRCLKPGDIISLRHYRVKHHYQATPNDIEISVNSRNPAAQICVLPVSSVSPRYVPPAPTYSFYDSKELLDCSQEDICDVIGLLLFSGRSERIRRKDRRGVELLEYRWLRLEDGASSQPIMVKLFSSSQPETYSKLHPLSVVVLTRLKVIRVTDQTESFYLTNTTYTQVYCTGLGHHTKMSYRTLRPVQRFVRWLRGQDDQWGLSRALIGGFFIFPPPPVSLETFMKERRGEPGFLQGAELQREMERLCYRERHSFCVQAAVTMVTYCRRGEEDQYLFWTEQASSLSTTSSAPSPRLCRVSPHPSASPSPSSSSTSSLLPDPSTPRSTGPFLSSSPLPSTSPSSSVGLLTPRTLDHRASRKSWKRKQLQQADTPKKRHPWVTLRPEQKNKTEIMFHASMEFLENNNSDEVEEEDDNEDNEDTLSRITAPLLPAIPAVALETLPVRYDYNHREEQVVAVSLGGNMAAVADFDSPIEAYFTLRLRALSDGMPVDAIFLPHSASSPLSPPLHHHGNTWSSILSHGAFSSHTPPPSPADLIAMAAQLANQRLVCVLEACHLGGVKTELILSRAYHLTS